MIIHRCDICKKEIGEEFLAIQPRGDGYPIGWYDICRDCLKNAAEFLRKKKRKGKNRLNTGS